MNASNAEQITPETDARFWTKYQLAEWLGVKVSYVEAKASSREWPSYVFSELRFSPEQRAEILAKHERKARRQADLPDGLLTVEQAARRLRISRPTAYRRIAARELPVVDVAPEGASRPRLRVPSEAVDELIKRRALDAA